LGAGKTDVRYPEGEIDALDSEEAKKSSNRKGGFNKAILFAKMTTGQLRGEGSDRHQQPHTAKIRQGWACEKGSHRQKKTAGKGQERNKKEEPTTFKTARTKCEHLLSVEKRKLGAGTDRGSKDNSRLWKGFNGSVNSRGLGEERPPRKKRGEGACP